MTMTPSNPRHCGIIMHMMPNRTKDATWGDKSRHVVGERQQEAILLHPSGHLRVPLLGRNGEVPKHGAPREASHWLHVFLALQT